MKTYSRKSSSYLKKAFIASNFNEMCRLCLSEVDMVLTPIIQDSQMSYQEWIQYSVDVLVEEGDGLPPNICEECLGMVEQSYLFKKKCKASDSKLREHLQLMDSIESRLIDTQFETTNNTVISKSNEETKTSQNASDPNLVDPGGATDSSSNGHIEKEITQEVKVNENDVNSKTLKSNPKGNVEKEVVKPIKEENIIINEVKRYVWKNDSSGEKDVTVCEVVHYDIRKEDEDSADEFESNGSSLVKSYSTTDILEEYSNNLNDSTGESSSPQLHLMQNASYTDVKLDKNNGQITNSEQTEGGEKSEGKIQEICQLWDNDDEGEGAKDEEDEEEEGEEKGLVVDVSWEEDGTQKVDDSHGGVVVEVNFEENGVIQTHKVFTSDNCIQLIEPVKPEEKQYQCFICNKHFVSQGEMKSHILAAHKEASNSSFCEICFKNFTSANTLKRHMLVHTGVKPYACDICGRKFSQTSILKRHRFTHGKKKPFECNFCQKSYTQKMNLLTHLRNHGVKTETVSHRCKLCHKSFVHPSGLSRHLKQHKGVRFCCTRCNKSFSDSSALARHVKSTHS